MSLTQKIQLVMALIFLSAAAYLSADIQETKAKNLQVLYVHPSSHTLTCIFMYVLVHACTHACTHLRSLNMCTVYVMLWSIQHGWLQAADSESC